MPPDTERLHVYTPPMSVTKRPHTVPVRLSQAGFDAVEKARTEHDVSRADVLRAALAVASSHSEEMGRRLARIKQPREF